GRAVESELEVRVAVAFIGKPGDDIDGNDFNGIERAARVAVGSVLAFGKESEVAASDIVEATVISRRGGRTTTGGVGFSVGAVEVRRRLGVANIFGDCTDDIVTDGIFADANGAAIVAGTIEDDIVEGKLKAGDAPRGSGGIAVVEVIFHQAEVAAGAGIGESVRAAAG